MTRYNIALTPKVHSKKFIQQAEIFRDHDGIDYLLSEHSLPHITLVQFRTENNEELANLWKTVTNKLTQLHITEIPLTLQGLNWIYDFKRDDFLWLQLIPDQEKLLQNLHDEIVVCLQKYNMTPINRSLENYEPHLTLVHTPNLAYAETATNYSITIQDHFRICLGESDEIGQLLNISHLFSG